MAQTDATIKADELSGGILKRQSEQTIHKVRELVVGDVEESNMLMCTVRGVKA
jgi:hypothetical protein